MRNLAYSQANIKCKYTAYTPNRRARNKKRAPPELHGVEQTKDVGPWSDLYPWAMTIINLLSRHPKTNDGGPMNVISRFQHFRNDPYSDLASLLPNVPSNVAKVLQECVKLDHTLRPKNVTEARNLFASKTMIFTQINSENPVLVKKPAGSFEMGSLETEAGRENNEFLHPVRLTHSFYAQQAPVTQEQ